MKRSLLFKCLIASLLVHAAALLFFYRHPLILNSPLATLFKKTRSPLERVSDDSIDLGVEEKNQELEEAFAKLALPSSHAEVPFDALHQIGEMAREASSEKTSPELGIATHEVAVDEQEGYSLSLPTPAFVPTESLAIDENLFPFPQIAIDKSPSTSNFKVPLDAHKNALQDEATTFSAVPTPSIEQRGEEAKIETKPLVSPLTVQEEKIEAHFDLKELPLPKRKIASLPSSFPQGAPRIEESASPPDLETYLFPEIAEAEEWEEGFDVKVALMPREEGKGYVFSLTLQPNEELDIAKIPQNFYFLIDRSNSIEKHRFSVFKRAVLKALSCLQEGDKFNIVLFDKRITRMAEKNIPVNRASLQKAEEFLDKEEHGGVFASCDLCSSLEKVIPQSLSEKEVHTAVLLTDGHSTQSASRQQKKISSWIEKNGGKVSLYTAAVGRGNNLILLDLLSATSGGELLYSDTHAAFPRRLGKLMLNLREPLLKDIMITAQPKDQGAAILLYSSSAHLPTFYQHMPYEVVGTIDKPSDFTLLIQGRHKEEWVAIKKEISFKQAAKANRILEKKWMGKQAQACYGNFLKEGKAAHLSKAKELLKSSGNEIAFE